MARQTMRAAIFHEHGGPDVVRLETAPRPELRPGTVLVEVRAAGMNHLDLWVRRGLPIEIEMPHIGGSDVAGVVAAVAPDVAGLQPGQRVLVNPSLGCGRCAYCARAQEPLCSEYRILGEHLNGGFAEFIVAPAANVYPLPDDVSFETAAMLPISYQTAWRALASRARLRPGEDVLVLGASGGTAIAALQIARFCGARVFAVTSGAANVERVRSLGAHAAYDRLEVDFSREVFRDTGRRGVDVVVENVGEATWQQSVRALARGGRLVTYGATTGPQANTDLRLLFWKQLEIIGTTMASRAEFEDMLRVAFRGAFRPVVDEVMPLERAADAHRRLEAGGVFGKLVLRP
jgi:NADPH:quinone reductase-like Zn-dependent oxidoreductase